MYLNKDRARGLMKDFKIDALVASTPENVTYLAGTVGWSQKVYAYSVHMFAVVARDEEKPPALVVPGPEVNYVSAQQSWITDQYTFGGKNALIVPAGIVAQTAEEESLLAMVTQDHKRAKSGAGALAQALKDRGLDRGTIALDQERVMPDVRRQIGEALPGATILDGSDLLRLIRMVKTPVELEALRAAAALNEAAATAAARAVAAGTSELEVARVYRREVAGGGGMWHWYHFGSGRRSAGIPPPSSKTIQKGDLWKFDAGLTLNNFQADTGWGGVVGEPAKDQLLVWRATEVGFQAAMAEVRAGALPSRIFRAMLEGTRAAGLPEHNGNFAGHAIGLEPRELPYVLAAVAPLHSPFLPPTTDMPLEEGSTICVENPCAIFGMGGTQIEQTVVVTKHGYDLLVPQDRKLWIVPA